VFPRHRLDIGIRDLAFGLRATALARDSGPHAAAALAAAGLTDQGLVTLSVRSAWDLVLAALAWAKGSEVIVSAITHPDMITIIRAHGLVAVPVDVDLNTLAPAVADLEQARTERTRAVLVVHLLGGRIDLGPIADFTAGHGLLLIEDSAQAFSGVESLAPTAAEVSMISFGMIKTASAVGGAVVAVRPPELRAMMQDIQGGWPIQQRRAYAGKLLRMAVLATFNDPRRFAVLHGLLTRLGVDLDSAINTSTRSFAHGEALWAKVRRRPSAGLLALLTRRLTTFDPAQLAERAQVGDDLAARLPAAYLHPGDGLLRRTHWLFPVWAPDPEAVVAELRGRGIDVSTGTSNLVAVAAEDGSVPERAGELMASIVYLPSYPQLGAAGRDRMIAGLRAAAGPRLNNHARPDLARPVAPERTDRPETVPQG